MKLPSLPGSSLKDKRVLVRVDFDVPLTWVQGKPLVADDTRIKECLPTIEYLLKKEAKVILLAHLGRPGGKEAPELSLAPVASHLKKLLKRKGEVEDLCYHGRLDDNLYLLENLRFNPGEEANDPRYVQELAAMGDFYVNEAFGNSHRQHASIVGLPKYLPRAAGFHFQKEVENLSRVIENPKRPLAIIIGGAKVETKQPLMKAYQKKADHLLAGGRLAARADLIPNGLDINQQAIEKFRETIARAGTIVWNGPMGKYEEENSQKGTLEIAKAVAESKAFKIAGGGDTIAALTKFGLLDKMDYVSSGGGAMLEYLACGTLPGIEALT
jgi:phosphoglycerate kinase